MTIRLEIASRLLVGLLGRKEFPVDDFDGINQGLVDLALRYTDYLLASVPDESGV